MTAVRIGNYDVSADSETYRIFPRNAAGESIPVTRVNNFVYLRHASGASLTVFKRYLHQKVWYWRDSRTDKPVPESHVVSEVARMLFGRHEGKARDLLVRAITGSPLA